MPSSATLDASNFMTIVLSFHCKEYLRIRRLTERKGLKVERKNVVRDLLAVREVEVVYGGRRYMLRLPLVGVAGKVFGAVGVAVPPPVREVRGAKTDVRAS